MSFTFQSLTPLTVHFSRSSIQKMYLALYCLISALSRIPWSNNQKASDGVSCSFGFQTNSHRKDLIGINRKYQY